MELNRDQSQIQLKISIYKNQKTATNRAGNRHNWVDYGLSGDKHLPPSPGPGQPLPPGLLLRKASGSAAWLPFPRMGAAPLVPHVARKGSALSSLNRRAKQATEQASSTPRSPTPGGQRWSAVPSRRAPGDHMAHHALITCLSGSDQ